MSLTGISGNNIQVRQLKEGVTIPELNAAVKQNNMDELVVQTDKGKFIIFADSLDVKGKFGLPAVNSQVDFGDIKGTVILKDNEFNNASIKGNSDKIKNLIIKNPADLAQDARVAAQNAKAELNKKINEAEKRSDSNTNTASIYGPQVTKEDAEGWLKNNPLLAQSPRLVKLADFKTIDGKVDVDELAKISSGGAVVLNGPNSFYLPGERKAEAAQPQPVQPSARQPVSAQEAYYRRKNAEAAVDVGVAVGGALIDGFSQILR